MSSDSVKSWNRPWSTQEIIDNASNWSLAGDAGLLKYLETFSENLLTKANETNNNLNTLLDGLNKASLSLDIVKNEFCSLHNTQFIENRVYEDDETLPAEEELQENVEDNKPSEEEKKKVMKEAVMRGIKVVDKYFEKVEVPASDSEDETDFPSFVLRPKDPYFDRPLPYVIGTEDWYKKWHVGLLDSSSDSEVDNVSEKFSDSDSDDDLPVQDRTRIKGISNSGSEADILNRMHINQPVANSTFDESVKPDIFGSSDSEDYSSVPAQAPISTRNFAQELAAKLGNVVDQNTQVTQPEINRRPIQSVPPSKTVGNIFSDEPPPIDEEDELFGNSTAQPGLFSGGGGLFDDLESSTTLWKDKKTASKERSEGTLNISATKPKLPNLFDDEDEDIFNATVPQLEGKPDSQSAVTKKTSGGLFDDEDDDLFQGSFLNASSKPYLAPISKASVPFIDDEPPDLEPKAQEDNVRAKKPVGGIKVFGNADLFGQQKVGDLLKSRRQDSSESSDNEISKPINPPPKIVDEPKDLFDDFYDSNATKEINAKESPEKEDIFSKTDVKSEKKPKQLSLFDDDDSALFEDDLFSNISTKKFTSSLFDRDPLEDDLFAKPVAHQSSEKNPDKESPSVNSINQSADSNSVTETAHKINTTEQPQKDDRKPKTTSLFDNEVPDDLFSARPLHSCKISEDLPQNASVEVSEDRSASDSQKHVSASSATPSTLKVLESTSNKSTQPVVNINFFDQNPPELDDDWDTKSENNLFEENDAALFDNTPEIGSRRSGLFDNEPPSLFYESSGIVRDVSARVETDDSFNPYASSSRRFSTDIFNEQQSSDSFFVTKNKSQFESLNAQANLDSIPEISNANIDSSQSNLEITPSGNADDLFTDCTVSVAGASYLDQNEVKSDTIATETPRDNKTKAVASQDSDDFDLFSDESNLVYSEKTDKNVDSSGGHFEKSELFKSLDKAVDESGSKETVKPKIAKEKPTVAKRPETVLPKNETAADDDINTIVQDPIAAKIGSPGKLKHNLNINVNALMPGVALPRKKDLEKSHSFEVASSYEDSIIQVSVKSDPNLATQRKSSEELSNREESQKLVEKSVSFDNPLDNAEVLPSITKDRVRIPVKRRPSTRRARHESVRNSVPDFKITVAVEGESNKEAKTVKSDSKNGSDSKPVESTFDDIFADNDGDLFSSKTINVTQTEISKIDVTSRKEEHEDKFQSIFMSDSPDSETKLFAENRSSAEASGSLNNQEQKDELAVEPKPSIFGGQRRSVINSDSFESADFKKSDLFDDSEEFDDIFSSKKLPPKSNILKKSLFDDDLDDDDDIFGPPTTFEKTSSVKSTGSGGTKVTEKKPVKTTQVRKLENAEAVEDPLSSFMDS